MSKRKKNRVSVAGCLAKHSRGSRGLKACMAKVRARHGAGSGVNRRSINPQCDLARTNLATTIKRLQLKKEMACANSLKQVENIVGREIQLEKRAKLDQQRSSKMNEKIAKLRAERKDFRSRITATPEYQRQLTKYMESREARRNRPPGTDGKKLAAMFRAMANAAQGLK